MYTCTQCGLITEEPYGWRRLLLHEAQYAADAPVVSWVAVGSGNEFFFHADSCQDAWRAAHDLPVAEPPR
jgi:hypothetical protein